MRRVVNQLIAMFEISLPVNVFISSRSAICEGCAVRHELADSSFSWNNQAGSLLLTPLVHDSPRSFTSLRAHPFANVMRNSWPASNFAASDTTSPFVSCTML